MPEPNLPLDVHVSYAESGPRRDFLLNGSEELLQTLWRWKQQGKTDIWLTWGNTPDEIIDAVEELIRSLGFEYTVPTGKRSANEGPRPGTAEVGGGPEIAPAAELLSRTTADRPVNSAAGRESAAEAGSPVLLPRPVKILAGLYLLAGGLALVETVWAAFQGTFYLGLYVIGIPLGIGLLRRSWAWRKLVLCAAVVQILLLGWVAYLLYDARVDDVTGSALLGLLSGNILWGAVAAIWATVIALSVWSIYLLTRNRVKKAFLPVPAGRRTRLFPAVALILLLAITARETGGFSLDYYRYDYKFSQEETSSGTKDRVQIRFGDDLRVWGSPLERFQAPCLIEVRGMGEEWYRVVTKYTVHRGGESGHWETSRHWDFETFGGRATARLSPALRESADRIVIELDQPQLAGAFWRPLYKNFTVTYRARIHGEGKYRAYQDELEAKANCIVEGICSVHSLKKLLLKQAELKAFDKIMQAVGQGAGVPPQFVDSGTRALEAQDYHRAIGYFNDAIRLDPNYNEAFHNRGVAWYNKKEYDKAIEDYGEAIRLIRLDPTFDFALDYFHHRPKVRPVPADNEHVDDETANKRYYAVILIRRLRDAFQFRALAWSHKKEYDKAIKDYDEVIRLDPKQAHAFNERGNAWDDKKEFDKAIEDYDEAIRISSKHEWKGDMAMYLRNRGLAWSHKKEYDKAVKDYSEASRLDSGCAMDFINHVLASTHKKEYDKAIKNYDEVMRQNPKYAAAFYHRGGAWLFKKEYDQAIKDYDNAIRLDSKHALAFNDRGFARMLKKEYDKAIKDYGEAIRLDPKHAHAFTNRAVACWLNKEYDKAIKYFDEAIRKGDRSPFWAGICGHFIARQAGDEATAQRFLKDSVKMIAVDDKFAAGSGPLGKPDKTWPYPVFQFLRGDINEAALLKLSTDDEMRTGARCVLGMDHALKGHKGEALAHFRWVHEHGNPGNVTYVIAVAELERLERPAEGAKR